MWVCVAVVGWGGVCVGVSLWGMVVIICRVGMGVCRGVYVGDGCKYM